MRNLSVLVTALELVEERLREPMNASELAEACFMSASGLQKLFRYACKCSVAEYITKRRLTCASRELLSGDMSVTDIALEYQYGSPEAFTRAFKRVWGISPSEFRKTRRFPGLLPKFTMDTYKGGIRSMRDRKPIDISELYDELFKLRGTYVLSVDITNFDKVNKTYGYGAGDLVIAEAFARQEREIGDDMLLFRIGGDEFAILTGFKTAAEAEALAMRIKARNGEPVRAGADEIPLSLWVGVSKLPEDSLNYRAALELMYTALETAKSGR